MSYELKATETFWKAFHRLTSLQKLKAEERFEIFRNNPFDIRLGTHKINKLSAKVGHTVYAVEIDGDLRTVFTIKGNIRFFRKSCGLSNGPSRA